MALPATKTQGKDKPNSEINANMNGTKSKKKIWKKKKHLKSKSESPTVTTEKSVDKAKTDPSPNWKAFLLTQRSKELEKNDHVRPILKSRPKKRKKNFSTEATSSVLKENGQREPEIWFDDVDPSLLDIKKADQRKAKEKSSPSSQSSVMTNQSDDAIHADKLTEVEVSTDLTKYVALDCEMVGVGSAGKESILARASLVNSRGECIYDKFVRPSEHVRDYRTDVSGVRASNLKNAPKFKVVQQEIADILKDRILVGHALQNDLKILMLSHPRKHIRDTSKYKPFRKLLKTKRPALKKLAAEILKVSIQEGEHSSVIDARTTMQIFQKYKKEWERSLHSKTPADQLSNGTQIYLGKGTQNKPKKNKWSKIRQRKKAKE